MSPQPTAFRIWRHQDDNANIPQHTWSENTRTCTGGVSYILPGASASLTLFFIHQLYALPHQFLVDFEGFMTSNWSLFDRITQNSQTRILLVIKIIISNQNNYSTQHFTPTNFFQNAPHIRTYEQKRKKRHMAIAQNFYLIEQNQCQFWIQRIRFVLNQLKKCRQQICCWPV